MHQSVSWRERQISALSAPYAGNLMLFVHHVTGYNRTDLTVPGQKGFSGNFLGQS